MFYKRSKNELPPLLGSQFKLYGEGAAVARENPDFQEDAEDNLRWYLEKADNPQGFRFVVDASTGFGSYA